jgi:hypothetical protein
MDRLVIKNAFVNMIYNPSEACKYTGNLILVADVIIKDKKLFIEKIKKNAKTFFGYDPEEIAFVKPSIGRFMVMADSIIVEKCKLEDGYNVIDDNADRYVFSNVSLLDINPYIGIEAVELEVYSSLDERLRYASYPPCCVDRKVQ